MSLFPPSFPPHPTAETVVDSDEELDEERISVGSHKPSKGGIDVPIVKGARGSKSNSTTPGKKQDRKHGPSGSSLSSSDGSMKERLIRKWSISTSGGSTDDNVDIRRLQSKGRTSSMPIKKADEGDEDAAVRASPKEYKPPSVTMDAAEEVQQHTTTKSNPDSPVRINPAYGKTLQSPPKSNAYGSYFSTQYARYGSYAPPTEGNKSDENKGTEENITTDNTTDLPSVAEETAVVHTPQKASFKESLETMKAKREAAAAAASAAASIPEYPEDDYSMHYQPQPVLQAQPKRGRRMSAQPGYTVPAHDPYHDYNLPSAYNPAPYPSYGRQPNSAPIHSMYPVPPHQPSQAYHQYTHAAHHGRSPSMPNVPTMNSMNAGVAHHGYNTPTFSMLNNANASDVATTVLGGRYAAHMHSMGHTQPRPMAPSTLGPNSTLGAYAPSAYPNDMYGGYEGQYYDEGYDYHQEQQYEVASPPASPEWPSKRPLSRTFTDSLGKKSGLNSQWSAEWAENDSQRASSRPPPLSSSGEREELELGKDGLHDPNWSKPRPRRRATVANDKFNLGSGFSDSSSKVSGKNSGASSRLATFREEQVRQEAVENTTEAQRPSINVVPVTRNGLPTPDDSPSSTLPAGVHQRRAKSRPATFHSQYPPSVGSGSMRYATIATIPTSLGYPHLSSHLSASPSTALYRRFDKLNHRILLHLQDEISELEALLEGLDFADQSDGSGGASLRTRRAGSRAVEGNGAKRLELMGAIFMKLQQYNQALLAYSKIVNVLPGATAENLEKYRAWMTLHQPVVPEEMDFLFKGDDFAALAAERSSTPDVILNGAKASISRASSRAPSIRSVNSAPVVQTIVTKTSTGRAIETACENGLLWLKMQDMSIQLGVLFAVFIMLPLFLFTLTSTSIGRLLFMTMFLGGFCYFAAMILFNPENQQPEISSTTKSPSKPATEAVISSPSPASPPKAQPAT